MAIGDLLFVLVVVAVMIYGLSWLIAIEMAQEWRREQLKQKPRTRRISTTGASRVKAPTQIILLAGVRENASATYAFQLTSQLNSRMLCGND